MAENRYAKFANQNTASTSTKTNPYAKFKQDAIRHPLDTSGLTPNQTLMPPNWPDFTKPQGMNADMTKAKGLTVGDVGRFADDSVRTFVNGVSFGFADKLAGADPAGIIGNTSVQQERAKSDVSKERLGPVLSPALEIAGSILPASRIMQAGLTATRLPMIGKALGLSLDGAGYGALDAAGHDNNIALGAGIGAGAGLVGQGLGTLASKVMSKIPTHMTVDELKSAANSAYKKADMAGTIFKPDAISNLSNSVKADLATGGYHGDLQPGVKTVVGELDRLAANGNVNFQALENARRIAGGAYIPGNTRNNDLVKGIIEKIDNLGGNVSPENVIMGDPTVAAQTLSDARGFWHKAAKLSTVEDLMAQAERRTASTGSGGNIENVTKKNLNKILNSQAKSRGFNSDEKAALNDAVMGTKTQNTLRQLGKFSPLGNGLIGTLQALTAIGSASAAGPLAAVPIIGGAIAGTGAKLTSEAMQRAAIKRVQAMIASGGNANSVKPALATATDKQIKQLVRTLMIGGATALGAQ